jgi:hypothetical protein
MKRLAAWCVTVIALGFFVERVATNSAHLPPIHWDSGGVGMALVSVLLGLAAIGLSAVAWWVLVDDQRAGARVAVFVPVFLVSQFGKYLPGNVGQFVGRVVLARNAGLPAPVVLTTIVTEAMWNIGSAVGISALALYIYFGQRASPLPPWMNTVGLAVCFIALFVAPWIGITLIRRAFPSIIGRIFAGGELRAPRWIAALKVSALYVGCYVCLGVALDLQAIFVFGAQSQALLQVSGFFALAWLAGYLLPGAPAGLGVRESVMLVLLAPLYGESVAIALGITLRLATTLADALALVIGWAWRRRERATSVLD